MIEVLSRLVSMRGTKAEVETFMASLEEIIVAYATDTGRYGIYTNGAWIWLTTSAEIHAAVTLASDADTLLGLTGQQLTLDAQSANYVLAGPTSGGSTDPTFRKLVAADVGSGSPNGSKYLRDDMSWQAVTVVEEMEALVADGSSPLELLTNEDESDYLYGG